MNVFQVHGDQRSTILIGSDIMNSSKLVITM